MKSKRVLPLRSLRVYDDFLKEKDLVQSIKNEVLNPKGFFGWDLWEVEDQFRLKRTPIEEFLDLSLLKIELLKKASALGCTTLSPLWLSAYTDGDFQDYHADRPHGPWAFVFTVNEWKGEGGETTLLKPDVLKYHSKILDLGGKNLGFEHRDLEIRIPTKKNRLVVFDSGLPHCVRRTLGSRSLKDARMVIHGWFTDAKPRFEIPMNWNADFAQIEADIEKSSNEVLESKWRDILLEHLKNFERVLDCHGQIVLRYCPIRGVDLVARSVFWRHSPDFLALKKASFKNTKNWIKELPYPLLLPIHFV